jgi:homoserine O-acetyltransferase
MIQLRKMLRHDNRRPYFRTMDRIVALANFLSMSHTMAYAALCAAAAASVLPTTSGRPMLAADVQESEVWFDNYRFRDGETIPRLRIHYATLGTPTRNGSGQITNAVLVLHQTGASGSVMHGPIFMQALFGPGRPLDASTYYLIFPDNVGHGRSSKPSDGMRAHFPRYGYADMVDLQHRLVTETLGIRHLRAIVGVSMGGMNAWQWAEAYPDAMDGIMPVVSLPISVSGRNLLWRRMVVGAIRSDPEWVGGNYKAPPRGWLMAYPILGMMIDGVPHLQAIIPDTAAADQFLRDAQEQARSIDANDILYSLQSSADYNPEPALRAIQANVYALNFSDDAFNPAELHVLDRLIQLVPHGRYTLQAGSSTSFGHNTMMHPDEWASQVAVFMSGLAKSPSE